MNCFSAVDGVEYWVSTTVDQAGSLFLLSLTDLSECNTTNVISQFSGDRRYDRFGLFTQVTMWFITPHPNIGWRGIVITSTFLSVHSHENYLNVVIVYRNYTWQLFHIFRADQSDMVPVHCKVMLTFWPSALNLWPSPWFIFERYCLETVNNNCFIFSGHIKAKQPESGDLCGNITEFGVAKGSPEPTGQRWSFRHPKWSDIAIQYTRQRLFCFYILLFNGFKSFQAKIYEINMTLYLLLYFIFFNHSVGIHPTTKQKYHEQHSNAIHVTSWWLMTS